MDMISPAAALASLEVQTTMVVNGVEFAELRFRQGLFSHSWGGGGGLTLLELHWVRNLLRAWSRHASRGIQTRFAT